MRKAISSLHWWSVLTAAFVQSVVLLFLLAFDSRKPMSVDQLVALAASIGACVSALAAFFTVREMSRQRQTTYQPELVPSRLQFSASKPLFANSMLPERWLDNSNAPAAVDINNVGLGAATNVLVSWSFDIGAAIDRANTVAQKSLSAAYFELKNETLHFHVEGGRDSMSMWGNQRAKNFDYVLPASKNVTAARADIPLAFCQLVAALVFFSNRSEQFHFPELPMLELDISFQDIAGHQRKVKYEFAVSLTMVSDKACAFQGLLEATRKHSVP